MIALNVTVDTKSVAAYLGELRDQTPKRVGFALNTTANEIQKGIQASLPGKFTLRRPAYIRQSIYRKPGEDFPQIAAGTFSAAVRINEERDVLAKFEEGGTKTPRGGRTVTVPIIRTGRPRLVIGRESRYHLSNLPAGLFRGERLTGSRFYGLISRRGMPLILERVGKRAARVIYALLPRVPIARRLGFYDLANHIFGVRWPVNLQKELDEAIRRAEAKRGR